LPLASNNAAASHGDCASSATRYAISNRVRLQAALFDFDSVGVGISFTSGFGRR
jgi:hypothetical protein